MTQFTGGQAPPEQVSAALGQLLPQPIYARINSQLGHYLGVFVVSAGLVALMCDESVTVKLDALADPNLTLVAPVKSVPVIVTLVPPATGPDDGLIDVTVGAGGAPPAV